MPSAAELDSGYSEAASEDYEQEAAGQRATARRELERIERHVARGRLADLGTWLGYLPEEAQRRGWDAVGVEPSAWATQRARERGVNVLLGPLLDAGLPEGAYSAVTMGDVIEHLPRPGEALDRIARLLRPGGVVYMSLPDAGSRLARLMGARWWSVIPTHVQYFTRDSMAMLLRRHGFDPLVVRTAPKAFTVRYYLDRIGGYSRPLGNGLVRTAAAAGVAGRICAPDFRDRMAVVARGPSAGR